jgi:hypothetical protein
MKHYALEVICGQADIKRANEQNKQNFKSRKRITRIPLAPPLILHRAVQLINSPVWRQAMVGIIALTGRRPVEVCYTAQFKRSPKPGHVRVMGLAKKRDKGDDCVIDLPVDIDPKIVIEAHKRVKRNPEVIAMINDAISGVKPHLQRDAIDKKFNKPLNRVVVSNFGGILLPRYDETDPNCRALRSAYVAIQLAREIAQSGIDDPDPSLEHDYACEILGHEESGGATPRYRGFVIVSIGDWERKKSRYLASIAGKSPSKSPTEPPKLVKKNLQIHAVDLEKFNELATHFEGQHHRDIFQFCVDAAMEKLSTKNENPPTENTAPDTMNVQEIVNQAVATALANLAPTPQETPQQTPQQTPKKPGKNLESMPKNELFSGKKIDGSAHEKLRRWAVAITIFNERQPVIEDRWLIGTALLKAVSGINGQIIGRWIAAQDWIARHNDAFLAGASMHHNKVNHRGVIARDILWDLVP